MNAPYLNKCIFFSISAMHDLDWVLLWLTLESYGYCSSLTEMFTWSGILKHPRTIHGCLHHFSNFSSHFLLRFHSIFLYHIHLHIHIAMSNPFYLCYVFKLLLQNVTLIKIIIWNFMLVFIICNLLLFYHGNCLKILTPILLN